MWQKCIQRRSTDGPFSDPVRHHRIFCASTICIQEPISVLVVTKTGSKCNSKKQRRKSVCKLVNNGCCHSFIRTGWQHHDTSGWSSSVVPRINRKPRADHSSPNVFCELLTRWIHQINATHLGNVPSGVLHLNKVMTKYLQLYLPRCDSNIDCGVIKSSKHIVFILWML